MIFVLGGLLAALFCQLLAFSLRTGAAEFVEFMGFCGGIYCIS